MKIVSLLIIASLQVLFLSGCVSSNAFLQSARSNDPDLGPKSKFFLFGAPTLNQRQKEVAGAIATNLRENGFSVTDEGQADYFIEIQFTSSPEQITAIKREPSAGESSPFRRGPFHQPYSSQPDLDSEEVHIVRTWGYLYFFAYRKAEITSGHVVPIWTAQIAADSKDIAGKEGSIAVALFRHLGEEIKQTVPISEPSR